jgi:branched-chain amino acid transport system permease protein
VEAAVALVGRQQRLVPVPLAAAAVCLFFVPMLGLPAFYESFLYLIFFWVSLATSWTILSGYAGYWSFGHAAFFGAGMYTTATLTTKFGVPFLWTIPASMAVATLLGLGVGVVVFRLQRLRGELFALLTLAITFVVATIVHNTGIDGGSGVYLISVPIPNIMGTPSATIYFFGLVLVTLTVWSAYLIAGSRLGLGLYAIHDDEDVAEVKGVPTFRYKLAAFGLSSGIAGAVGAVHAIYVGYVTVAETFEITVPLYSVVMSILGGSRHWFGPAVGATIITAALYVFASGPNAVIGRAAVAFGLVLMILLLPQGLVPALLQRLKRRPMRAPDAAPEVSGTTAARPAPAATLAASSPAPAAGAPILECRDVWRAFGGVQALRGVSLDVRQGEILGLVGPNGSGKTTLINVVSGHYRADRGEVLLGGEPTQMLTAHEIHRLGIARTYQIPRPFMHLTVLDNVALAARFGVGAPDRAAADAEARHWLEYAGLAGRADDLPSLLNLHERKFLELARALAARPRLLLLDEVLSGLNPTEIESALNLIREIRASGTSIVFVEHLMRAVVAVSDRIAVLNEGELLALGSPQETMSNPQVVNVYLGKAHAA